jgi:type I restriction enzyme, S subunit
MALVVFLPPLAEQKRIVAQVDRLMALIDDLEARQTKKREVSARFTKASLDALTTAEGPEEFDAAWRRVVENFPTMIDRPGKVAEIRQSILFLAVRGRLEPQDASDEAGPSPAELLTTVPLAERVPWSAPRGWEWFRWEDVCERIGDVDHKMPTEAESGYPYVSASDFLPNNGINYDAAKKITHEDFVRLSAKIRPERGDIIFPRYGTIGENRLVATDREFLASYACAVIKCHRRFCLPEYAYYYSISPLARSEIAKYVNTTTQGNVGVKSIKAFLFPLPPISEQKRIVAKVEHLMKLCDDLEAKLRRAEDRASKLVEAVVQEMVA